MLFPITETKLHRYYTTSRLQLPVISELLILTVNNFDLKKSQGGHILAKMKFCVFPVLFLRKN